MLVELLNLFVVFGLEIELLSCRHEIQVRANPGQSMPGFSDVDHVIISFLQFTYLV